jgi:hypothetical protein
MTYDPEARENLAYATCANERHAITVATWNDGPDLLYRMMIDDLEVQAGRIPSPAIVHQAPHPIGGRYTGCCGIPPDQLRRHFRLVDDPTLVTCRGRA